MDSITSLATTAVAVLAPYLAEAGKEAAKVAGQAVASKIGELHQALKTRFEKEPPAQQALKNFETSPRNKQTQKSFEKQLKKQLNADSTLKNSLCQLLNEIKEDKKAYSFLTQVYGGNVDDIFNIGHVDTLNINN
jgi:hypothetical protein